MRVRLTRKLADVIDGIELRRYSVGEIIELTRNEADLLIAEGWAEPIAERPVLLRSNAPPGSTVQSTASGNVEMVEDQPHPQRTVERLRELGQEMERTSLGEQERRRAEDRFRDEHRDSHARILPDT